MTFSRLGRCLVGGLLLAAFLGLAWPAAAKQPARIVILMISDGTGFQSWQAGSYYQYGRLGSQPYDAFAVKYPVTTFPATSGGPAGQPHPGYDPAKAWDATPTGDGNFFAGYAYVKQQPTDSAAAATAMATGVKTYNAAIGVGLDGQPLTNIAQIAVEEGKSAGVVTSVPLSHATPAGFAAHNAQRDNYAQIGMEMILKSPLTVIMGAGHPDFDAAGKPAKEANYEKVGGRYTWRKVTEGKTPWTLIQTRAEFEALAHEKAGAGKAAAASGVGDSAAATAPASAPSGRRVLGVPQVGSKIFTTADMPDSERPTPDLATMALGALNVLDDNPNGFFLMIEGGAVDWGAHENNLEHLVHELADFNQAVAAVVGWVEKNSSWDEAMIIITTDHANGMLLGPQSDTIFYQPIATREPGQLPLARFHTTDHANELVPMWAKGAGEELFAAYATGQDPNIPKHYADFPGRYIDNTDIFKVMKQAITGK
ncbi:MAG: alkaline phosphatase [Phycisphaeraceae bacterium]|nr:alkaline phosphatase [Phycisphaeraceae bacterium]